jgi:hypothetical protein
MMFSAWPQTSVQAQLGRVDWSAESWGGMVVVVVALLGRGRAGQGRAGQGESLSVGS